MIEVFSNEGVSYIGTIILITQSKLKASVSSKISNTIWG